MGSFWNYLGGAAVDVGSVLAAPMTGGASLAGLGVGQSLIQAGLNKDAQAAQNEYNSPKNQMSRFAAAGLNPNLIYGQGSAGNQASPVSYQAPSVPILEKMMQKVELMNAAKQGALLDSQRQALQAKTNETNQKIGTSILMQDFLRRKTGMMDTQSDLIRRQMEEIAQRIRESGSRVSTSEIQRRLMEARVPLAQFMAKNANFYGSYQLQANQLKSESLQKMLERVSLMNEATRGDIQLKSDVHNLQQYNQNLRRFQPGWLKGPLSYIKDIAPVLQFAK